MAKRKTADNGDQTVQTDTQNGVAVATEAPPPMADPQPAEQPQAPAPPNGNGARRPAMSWKYPAAAGVTIEVALWPHQITLSSGEVIDVLNATVTRSYKDQTGQWCKGGSYRISEIPVLIHGLQRAHAFALDQREMNCPL